MNKYLDSWTRTIDEYIAIGPLYAKFTNIFNSISIVQDYYRRQTLPVYQATCNKLFEASPSDLIRYIAYLETRLQELER
jgi:hypothetical protein